MIILPSLDETIVSKMSMEEICEALGAVTVPRKEHRYGDRRGEFIGEVDTADLRWSATFLIEIPFCRSYKAVSEQKETDLSLR